MFSCIPNFTCAKHMSRGQDGRPVLFSTREIANTQKAHHLEGKNTYIADVTPAAPSTITPNIEYT